MHEDISGLNLPLISTDPVPASYLENYCPLYYADIFLRVMSSLCPWQVAIPADKVCKKK